VIPIHDDNPTERSPVVTVALIAACVAAFLWQLSFDAPGRQAVIYALGVIPAVLFGQADLAPELAWVPEAATPVTSMFLHGGWMHLLGNMWFLWLFGDNVEDSMSRPRFVVFYLLCGVVAALAQVVTRPDSGVPMVGASGAISGVMGAYLVLYPRVRVYAMVPLGIVFTSVALPAWMMLGYWILIQVVSGAASAGNVGGGVAFWAHVGGFAAGVVLVKPFARRDRVAAHRAHHWEPSRLRTRH
jgi:membrane associated rhomboid family serine protease